MPRRVLMTEAQRDRLLAISTDEATLAQHWVLGDEDLRIIARRRRPHNRLGFAVQLCALRFPGRLLRLGELIPDKALRFVAAQLAVPPDASADYAARGPTRYEQLGTLRELFGFATLSRPERASLQAWLLLVALTTTNGADLAGRLSVEFRRRRIVIPGVSALERMSGQAMHTAEQRVEAILAGTLDVSTRAALDELLRIMPDRTISTLAFVRQPPGVAGHRAFADILDRLAILWTTGVASHGTDGVHPERLRQLAQEGARLTAQHLAAIRPARRHAVLVATVLETAASRTDDAVLMFDRIVGRLFRRAERRAEAALKRDRGTINAKVRLLARLGDALLVARRDGRDLYGAVEPSCRRMFLLGFSRAPGRIRRGSTKLPARS